MIIKKPTAGALLVRKLEEAEDRIVELEKALAFYALCIAIMTERRVLLSNPPQAEG